MADLDFEAVEQLMEKGDPNSDGSPAGGEGSPVSNGAARSNDGGVFRRAADSEEPSERRSGRAGRRERSLEEVRRRRDGSHEGGSRKGGVRDESPDGRKDQGDSPGFPRLVVRLPPAATEAGVRGPGEGAPRGGICALAGMARFVVASAMTTGGTGGEETSGGETETGGLLVIVAAAVATEFVEANPVLLLP
ncbi:splicing factor [Cyclospora cayetanensis]|uniref:Splicing factor n=1 Tax=Cyclospora cayetanensis TaxID=88456 RepID=A0A1D3CQS0_9EIME|nr:splicing factor [Cyclospora cayetanensis]